jgi:hypothetical protein
MRISRLFMRLRRWSSQAFRKKHSPAAFKTWRNAGNGVLTAEGTTSKGIGSISCEVEFCILYRLSLRNLRTKDVHIYTYIHIHTCTKSSCQFSAPVANLASVLIVRGTQRASQQHFPQQKFFSYVGRKNETPIPDHSSHVRLL